MSTTLESTTIDLSKYNGFLTVVNPDSGDHRTFRVRTYRRGDLKGKRSIGLLIGSDNESSYLNFGFVNDDGRIITWKKHRSSVYDKLANVINHCGWFEANKGIEFKMSVRCRKCNRTLTDPTSIDLGIGPICRGGE